MMPNMPAPTIVKRVTKACDVCHARSVRCRIGEDDVSRRCKSCIEFDQECTFARPSKKRGFPRGRKSMSKSEKNYSATTAPNAANASTSNIAPSLDAVIASSLPRYTPTTSFPDHEPAGYSKDDHRANLKMVASQATIVDLVEIFFEVVYPIFPLFHRVSLLRKVARGEYLSDQSLYATIMALCALSSLRVRDGALYSNRFDIESIKRTSPDGFFSAASQAIPAKVTTSRDLRYLQASALLALASLQIGNLHKMHFFMGTYQMMCRVEGLHKEINWPKGIGRIEIEERRRLFWSMYTLDVFSAAVFGTVPSCREAFSDVTYPSELEDEQIAADTDSLFQGSDLLGRPQNATEPHWLKGWNATTDFYRILEHILDNTAAGRRGSTQEKTIANELLANILARYAALPQRFKTCHPITYQQQHDWYNFQAANIIATIQLARMTILSSSVEESTTQEKCQVIRQLLHSFSEVPYAYLRAISTPLFYHLAGIGTVLSPVVEGRLTSKLYEEVRGVLVDLAELLTGLEDGNGGASQRLKSHIQKMDTHILSRRNGLSVDQMETAHNVTNGFASGFASRKETGDSLSPEFAFPQGMLEDWPRAFDFTHDFG